MKVSPGFILLCLFLIPATACSPARILISDSLERTGGFVVKTGKEPAGTLSAPMLVYKSKNKTRYLLRDRDLKQVLILNAKGKVSRVIKASHEDGESFRLTSFGINKDTLIVYDSPQHVLKHYTLNGEFIREYEVLEKDGLLLLSGILYPYKEALMMTIVEQATQSTANHWKSKMIAVLNPNGKLKQLLGDYDPALVRSHYPNSLAVDGNFVYTTHRTSPTIQKFNLNTGERVSRFGETGKYYRFRTTSPGLSGSMDDREEVNLLYSFVGNSFVSRDYFAFYFFNFTEESYQSSRPNSREHFLNMYDKKSEKLIAEIQLPGQFMAMDYDNRIYILEDDTPGQYTIGIYKPLF